MDQEIKAFSEDTLFALTHEKQHVYSLGKTSLIVIKKIQIAHCCLKEPKPCHHTCETTCLCICEDVIYYMFCVRKRISSLPVKASGQSHSCCHS